MRIDTSKTIPAPSVPAIGFPVVPAILMGLAILLVFVARIRLLDVFLERDEGEYAYMGQLMLQGVPLYGTAAANMKFPGASAVYALFLSLFGQSTTAIHAGLLLVNTVSTAMVYLLGRRLFAPIAALAGAATFAVLSSSWGVMGLWAHATHFVIAAALAGFVLLFRWFEFRRPWLLFASGLFFGLAILMKQHGVFFAVPAVGYLVFSLRKEAVRPLLAFAIGVITPFAITCALLARAGVLERFWFWTITYASTYASATPLRYAPGQLLGGVSHVTSVYWAVWLLAGGGLALLLFRWRQSLFLLGLLAVSFLAICPGFYFREHYFILLLPAVSLCAAAAIARPIPALPWVAAVVLLYSVLSESKLLFEATPQQVNAQVYGTNPFPESVAVANFIRANSAPGATVAILGSEPEIFFHSGRHSATPFIYVYPLMETHPFALQMQEDFIRDVETKKPEFAVVVNVEHSWLRTKDSHQRLFAWWAEYGQRHYVQAGVADMLPGRTLYEWNTEYSPKSSTFLAVLRRKDAAKAD